MVKEVLVGGDDVIKHIPQRSPIVMVHELNECTETTATTSLFPEKCELFKDNGKLLEAGLVEHMAQSCAIHASFAPTMAVGGEKREPAVGFIAEVKNLKVDRLPDLESRLETKIEVLNSIMGITMVGCTSTDEKGFVCSCEMRIFQKPNS